MATHSTDQVEVKTLEAGASQSVPLAPRRSGSLEQIDPVTGLQLSLFGGAKMLEITIIKSLNGRDLNATFDNVYPVAGENDHSSAAAKTFAERLVAAERKIYSTQVEFLRFKIKGTDEFGRLLRAPARSVAVEQRGLFTIAANDHLAPAYLVAAVEKELSQGRASTSLYRHCITAGEYRAYIQDGTTPGRFTDPNNPLDALSINFIEAMKNMSGGNGVHLALPDSRRVAGVGPRLFVDVRFAGIRSNDATRQKVSAIRTRIDGTQKQVNEWAAAARFATAVDDNGVLPDGGDIVLAELKAKAVNLKNALPPEFRARVVMPEIFDSNPLTGGV
jgi:hypothetical protein